MKTQLVALLLIITLAVILVAGMIGLVSRTQNEPIVEPSPSLTSESPTPEPPERQPLSACGLISKDQASQLVGTAFFDPQQSALKNQAGLFQQGCLYLTESGSFTPSIQINLTYESFDDSTLVDDIWTTTQASSSALPRYQVVTELSQPAYFNGQTLFVRKDIYIFSIVVSMPDPDQNRPIAQQLAETILNNWPEN